MDLETKNRKQIIVYSYNPVTGIYNGEVIANKSPLEPGLFLLPAHSTKLKPSLKNGKICIFNGKKWLTQNIPSQNILEEKPSIEDERSAKLQELEAYYHSDEVKKVNIMVRDKNYEFLNDSSFRNLLLNKIVVLNQKVKSELINDKEALFSCQILRNQTLDLTLQEMEKILFFLDEKRQAQFCNKQIHSNKILNLSNESEIRKYDFRIGW